ncbi:MAG: 50S ribosomal protein L23 [Candidatus Omnitrophota bacterium]
MFSTDIILFPLNTEKGTTWLQPQNKYLFAVFPKATAPEIKKAVEKIYHAKVAFVNVLNFKGKKRRYRSREGKRPDWKKAIITLKKGEHIEFG